MKLYALQKYYFGDQVLVGVHHEQQYLIELALTESKEDYHTYRLETWDNGKMIGGCRFFSDGREFTEMVVKAIMGD